MTEETAEARYAFRRPGGERLNAVVHAVGGTVKAALLLLTKRDWTGMEHVPLDGPVILVWNHYSDFDPLPVAHFVYNSGRHPRFLLKDSIVRLPVVGPIIRATGQIPVKRGSTDAADSLRVSREVLAAGGAVLMSPEGTVTKEPDRWPMRGKTGVARLALETGAPVVPIAQWGSLGVHDRRRKPKFKLFGRRRPVSVRALPPVDLSQWQGAEIDRDVLAAVADRIMDALRDGLGQIRGQSAPPLFDPREQRQQPHETHEESEPTE